MSVNLQLNHDITQMQAARCAIADFSSTFGEDFTCISLGQNCSSAWYLKELALKKESYPFDWIFSSTEIVLDCLTDNFAKFLDTAFIVPLPNGQSAGHTRYHAKLFSHRNPLASDADYQYYVRCCHRFISHLKAQKNTIYVVTLINEPEKRVGWAKGFNQDFKLPRAQSIETLQPLLTELANKNANSKFLLIDHYTQQTPSVGYELINDKVLWMTFHAQGNSNGVFYINDADDQAMKFVLSGLC